MSGLLIGYARVSTDAQDLTAQRDALAALDVPTERVYVDHGLTGTHRDRPGLREALAACRTGDTLVVTKLDRLARSLPDARDIVDDLTRCSGRLSIGGSGPGARPRLTARVLSDTFVEDGDDTFSEDEGAGALDVRTSKGSAARGLAASAKRAAPFTRRRRRAASVRSGPPPEGDPAAGRSGLVPGA